MNFLERMIRIITMQKVTIRHYIQDGRIVQFEFEFNTEKEAMYFFDIARREFLRDYKEGK